MKAGMQVRLLVDLPKVGGKLLVGLKAGDKGVVMNFRMHSGAWVVKFCDDRYVFVSEHDMEETNEF